MLDGDMILHNSGSNSRTCLCFCNIGLTLGRWGLNSVTKGKSLESLTLLLMSVKRLTRSTLSNLTKASSTEVAEYPLSRRCLLNNSRDAWYSASSELSLRILRAICWGLFLHI